MKRSISRYKKSQRIKENKRLKQNIEITGYSKNDLEHIFEKQKRKEKFERRKARRSISQPKPIPNQPVEQPKTISLDQNLILAFIQFLLQKNLITKEELQSLTLSENNPLKDVNVEIKEDRILDRSELRDKWLQMMHQNNLFCELCGNPITEVNKGPWKLTAEHRVPKSRGGATNSTNLDPAHACCNNLKADMYPEEWERIGLSRLRSFGIHVNLDRAGYNYLERSR